APSGASLANTALVIALVTCAPVGRIVRSECLSLRNRDFVHAAEELGAGHARILGRHLLVNALPVVIVQASLLLGQTILIESGLSYLGLGAQPPLPSWGNMVVEGRQFLASAWRPRRAPPPARTSSSGSAATPRRSTRSWPPTASPTSPSGRSSTAWSSSIRVSASGRCWPSRGRSRVTASPTRSSSNAA